MKVQKTFEFNLPEESGQMEEFEAGSDAVQAIRDALQSVFRPARKHGYSHASGAEVIQRMKEIEDATGGSLDGSELIWELEKLFIDEIGKYSKLKNIL